MPEYQYTVDAVDSHTAGEPTRIITGGLPPIEGDTMVARRQWLHDNLDELRTGLILEPRGHDAIVLAYLTPPVSPDAAAGVIFANEVGYLGMCGHGMIGVATVLASTGKLALHEPSTPLVLDTPAGRVDADVHVRDGQPWAVSVRNVPSFLHAQDVVVEVPGHGEVTLDVAYGGNWFAIVKEDQLGIPVEMSNLRELLDSAMAVRAALSAAGHHGFDPETGEDQVVDHVEIYRPRDVPDGIGAKTLTLCPGISYDRSPCGTGTSAKLAAMHARGQIEVGQELHNRSICDTDFVATVVEALTVDGRDAVRPQIRGSAWITGFQRFVFDAADPVAFGMTR